MNFDFGPLPALDSLHISDEEKKANLEKVRKTLPKDAHFDQETREKILDEDAKKRAKVKAGHKMADYRIEIMFGSKRTSRGLTVAKIRVWESAKNIRGDGDVSMAWCANPVCLKPFSAKIMHGDIVACPHCYKTCTRDQTTSELLFRRTTKDIRQLVSQLFYHFNANADIVVIWAKKDIRKLEKAGNMDVYQELQVKDFKRVVYPYYRIISDTIHGGSLMIKLRDLIG